VIDRASGKLVGLVARRDLLRVRAAAGREEFERERPFKLFG
jgi:CBS domain-containing protein